MTLGVLAIILGVYDFPADKGQATRDDDDKERDEEHNFPPPGLCRRNFSWNPWFSVGLLSARSGGGIVRGEQFVFVDRGRAKRDDSDDNKEKGFHAEEDGDAGTDAGKKAENRWNV